MIAPREVVITGLGVVSPIGIGREAFWSSLSQGRSGVRTISSFDSRYLPVNIGAEVTDFDPKQYVTPRKSLKVMSRDIQLGFAAAHMAYDNAGLGPGAVDPERFGVVFGSDLIYIDPVELSEAFRSCMVDGKFDFDCWGKRALGEMYPLWLLKYLPNMPACHIAIAQDARGHNNSIILGEVSSLIALTEGVRVIERGWADCIITGGTGAKVHPMNGSFRDDEWLSHRLEEPARASRPFDAERDGMVQGEGAAGFILETRAHAEARGAKILARVLGYSMTCEPRVNGQPVTGQGIRAAIRGALRSSKLTPADVGYVNAHGLSTLEQDRAEAQAIREELGNVPVAAFKSYFGNLGAGTGGVEMAATVLGFEHGEVPPTINYEHPDPECPIEVIHGSAYRPERATALLLNQAHMGQSIAVALARAN